MKESWHHELLIGLSRSLYNVAAAAAYRLDASSPIPW